MPQPISFEDALLIANTGNNTTTAGQAISSLQVPIAKFTNAERTALIAVVQSLVDRGAYPGKAAHVVSMDIARHPSDKVALSCVVYGLIVYPDAATAGAKLSTPGQPAQTLLGIVP